MADPAMAAAPARVDELTDEPLPGLPMTDVRGDAGPPSADVDALRYLLDLTSEWTSNDQRARFILTSNWMRDLLASARAPEAAL